MRSGPRYSDSPMRITLHPDQCDDPKVNSLHFKGPWLSVPRFGIDIGPMLMNVDSYLSEKKGAVSIRSLFSSHPYLKDTFNKFSTIQVTREADILDKPDEGIPTSFKLYQNYPNPFNSSTTIEYSIPQNAKVTFKIFSITGREIRVLVDEVQHAGRKRISWDGRNQGGRLLPSGLYLSKLFSDGHLTTQKMLFIK